MAGNDNHDDDAKKSEDRPTPSPGYHASVNPPATLSELGAFLVDMQKGNSQGFASVLREQAKTNERVAHVEDLVEEHGELIDDIAAEVFDASGPRKPPARVAARIARRKPSTSMRPRFPSISTDQETLRAKFDELAGQVVAARAEAQTAREAAEKAATKVGTVEDINKQQSRAMGLSKHDDSAWRKFVNLALSREGIKLAGGFLTAITAIVGMVAALMAKGSAEKASNSAERAAERPAVVVAPSSSIYVPPPAASQRAP